MQINYPTEGAFQSFYKRRCEYEANAEKTPYSKENKAPSDIFEKKKTKAMALGLAFIGATLPLFLINLSKGKGSQFLDTLKSKDSTKI